MPPVPMNQQKMMQQQPQPQQGQQPMTEAQLRLRTAQLAMQIPADPEFEEYLTALVAAEREKRAAQVAVLGQLRATQDSLSK